jgi:hypothetical protein
MSHSYGFVIGTVRVLSQTSMTRTPDKVNESFAIPCKKAWKIQNLYFIADRKESNTYGSTAWLVY